MFPITVLPKGTRIWAQPGELALSALRRGNIPVGSSCDGDLICGYCRVRVVVGAESLSEISEEERRLLQRKSAEAEERMSCAARIHGPVTFHTDYW